MGKGMYIRATIAFPSFCVWNQQLENNNDYDLWFRVFSVFPLSLSLPDYNNSIAFLLIAMFLSVLYEQMNIRRKCIRTLAHYIRRKSFLPGFVLLHRNSRSNGYCEQYEEERKESNEVTLLFLTKKKFNINNLKKKKMQIRRYTKHMIIIIMDCFDSSAVLIRGLIEGFCQ